MKIDLKILKDIKFMMSKIKLFLNLRSIESIFIFLIDDVLHVLKILKFTPRKIKTKNILFIMGSGSSLNEISETQWKKISRDGDVMGFNDSIFQKYINLDYYIIREIHPLFLFGSKWRYATIFQSNFNIKKILELKNNIMKNDKMKETKFIIFKDILGGISTLWLWISYKKFGNRVICKYSNLIDRNANSPISRSMKDIPHSGGTIFDCINIGLNLGYKKIILLGVDLYDSNYFYLKKDEVRDWDKLVNHDKKSKHKTYNNTIKNIKIWSEQLIADGVEIYIHNPKSLLAGILPVYKK